MARQFWTQQELDILRRVYPTSRKRQVHSLLPGRSTIAIKNMVKKLGLTKLIHERTDSDLSVLMLDELESFYWIGFILADGAVYSGKLEVTSHERDRTHLEKLATFLHTQCKVRNKIGGYSNKPEKHFRIKCSSRYWVGKIKEKFDISDKKTYEPPDTSNWVFSPDMIMAMLIGYIDGDGSVAKVGNRNSIRIKVHGSWLSVLSYFAEQVRNYFKVLTPEPSINKDGFACLSLNRRDLVYGLKKLAIDRKLPALSRKWDKIPENFVPKHIQIRDEVIRLYKANNQVGDIARIVKRGKRTVYVILRKAGIKLS